MASKLVAIVCTALLSTAFLASAVGPAATTGTGAPMAARIA